MRFTLVPWTDTIVVLFTGSGRVGRVVATAAGKTLSPVTLELGGKRLVAL